MYLVMISALTKQIPLGIPLEIQPAKIHANIFGGLQFRPSEFVNVYRQTFCANLSC